MRIADKFRAGWLAFESPTGRRRLGPIRPGWAELSDDDLRILCELATPIMATGGRLIE